jgi:hypothetical protein
MDNCEQGIDQGKMLDKLPLTAAQKVTLYKQIMSEGPSLCGKGSCADKKVKSNTKNRHFISKVNGSRSTVKRGSKHIFTVVLVRIKPTVRFGCDKIVSLYLTLPTLFYIYFLKRSFNSYIIDGT